ncbi:MAG: EVE domain-containing protein [Dongiaceae bacterium]
MTHSSAPRHWIAIASAEHVANGVAQGIMQVCRGKGGPLRRIRPADRVIYYSPTASFHGADRLRQFTAFGIARGCALSGSDERRFPALSPRCRLSAGGACVHSALLEELDFTRGKRNWGWKFRAGLFEIVFEDGARIARAMAVILPVKAREDRVDASSRLDVPRRRRG